MYNDYIAIIWSSIGGLEWIVINLLKCAAFLPPDIRKKKKSNFLRITLNDRLRVSNEWSLNGDIHYRMVKFSGGPPPPPIFFFCVFIFANVLKYWLVSDKKKNHKAFRMHTTLQIVPKNYNRHLGIDWERTLYGICKIKPDYETMTIFLQFSEDPIWFGQVDKEIWIFVKQVICPFLPSFVTWMYVASTGRLCSQKTGLQTYSNFMHTFLTKVVPDNLKACQICKIM